MSLLVCCALVSLAAPPAASPEVVLSPPAVRAFADDLAARQDYYRAITEYRRYAFLEDDTTRAVGALETAGWLALRAEKFDEAGRLFAAARRRARQDDPQADPPTVRYGRAALWDAQGFDVDAAAEFEAVAASADTDPALAGDAMWRAAWAKLDARLLQGSLGRGSRRVMSSLDVFADADNTSDRTLAVVEMHRRAYGDALSYRSPSLAAILQLVLPGSGFLYVGRPGPAVASFVLNGAFIALITAAFAKRNYPLAVVGLTLEMGWYLGGATGAVAAALDRNQRGMESTAESYRRRWMGSTYSPLNAN